MFLEKWQAWELRLLTCWHVWPASSWWAQAGLLGALGVAAGLLFSTAFAL